MTHLYGEILHSYGVTVKLHVGLWLQLPYAALDPTGMYNMDYDS